MIRMTFATATLALTTAFAASATAGDIADCEALIMDYVQDEDQAEGGLVVATYRSAEDYIESVYDADMDPIVKIDGRPINAILCRRNDLVPDDKDFALISTGIPLALSQDFDTPDSDSLTVFFKDNRFQYKYASAYPLSEEVRELLDQQMEDFTARDHGLGSDAEDTE